MLNGWVAEGRGDWEQSQCWEIQHRGGMRCRGSEKVRSQAVKSQMLQGEAV